MAARSWSMSPEEVRAQHPYALAQRAGCAGPDSDTSPGAVFLNGVRDGVLEWFDWLTDQHGPDGFTLRRLEEECRRNEVTAWVGSDHPMWTTFADLRAYREDLSDFGWPTSAQGSELMSQLVSLALGQIAERLMSDLSECLCLWAAEQTEEADDDAA